MQREVNLDCEWKQGGQVSNFPYKTRGVPSLLDTVAFSWKPQGE